MMEHNKTRRTNKPKTKSAVTIAKLLCTEGFTPHLGNMIDRYWQHCAGLTTRQREQLDRLKGEFSAIVGPLSEGERMVIGRFISLHKKMAFDSGLRTGLGAFTARNAQALEGVSQDGEGLPTATQQRLNREQLKETEE